MFENIKIENLDKININKFKKNIKDDYNLYSINNSNQIEISSENKPENKFNNLNIGKTEENKIIITNKKKEKKEMLEQRHEIELEKIRNDYDNELEKLNEKYRATKLEYLNEIKKGNEIIEEFKLQGQKQVEVLSKDINILQSQNDIKNEELNTMINSNKTLKQSLDDYNGKFDEANEKYKDNREQKERLKKIYDESKNEMMKRKKENEKLHGLMYGRFFK